MSRINKSNQITDIIQLLGKKSSESKNIRSEKKATDPSNATKTTKDPIQELKKEIIKAVANLNLDKENELESAKKIFISKVVKWQFRNLPLAPSHTAYLVNSITKTMDLSDNNQQLLTLLKQLQEQ